MEKSELLVTLDATTAIERRSRFVAEAIAAQLRRRRLEKALAEMAGSLADVDIPGWESRESAAAWVRALRAGTLGTHRDDFGAGEEAPVSKPVAGNDLSVFVAELTEIASELSQPQRAALIETARAQLDRKPPTDSSEASREVGTISC
jgi:hypothetical protein